MRTADALRVAVCSHTLTRAKWTRALRLQRSLEAPSLVLEVVAAVSPVVASAVVPRVVVAIVVATAAAKRVAQQLLNANGATSNASAVSSDDVSSVTHATFGGGTSRALFLSRSLLFWLIWQTLLGLLLLLLLALLLVLLLVHLVHFVVIEARLSLLSSVAVVANLPSEAVVAISAAATLVHHIEGIVTVVEAVVALKAHSLVGHLHLKSLAGFVDEAFLHLPLGLFAVLVLFPHAELFTQLLDLVLVAGKLHLRLELLLLHDHVAL